MIKCLATLVISFFANASGPLIFHGQIVKINSQYYIIKEYLAIQPRYLVEFAKGENNNKICLANMKTGCPYYTIAVGKVKPWDKTSKFTDVRIVGMDFDR